MKRENAKKFASSTVALLIMIAALLAFVPVDVTFAQGTSEFAPELYQLGRVLVGAHIALDNLEVWVGTAIKIDTIVVNLQDLTGGITGVALGNVTISFPDVNLIWIRVGKATIDVSMVDANWTDTVKVGNITVNLQDLTGGITGVTLPNITIPAAEVIAIKIFMFTIDVNLYQIRTYNITPFYDWEIVGSQPTLFSMHLTRGYIYIYLDPIARTTTYVVGGQMTLYQALYMGLDILF